MGQDLGLPGSQVPEADPIRNRSIVNLKNRGEILELVCRPITIGTCLDLSDYGFWHDKELSEGSQEIKALDAGEKNQRRSIDDQSLIHAPGPRRDPPASPGKPRHRSPTGRRGTRPDSLPQALQRGLGRLGPGHIRRPQPPSGSPERLPPEISAKSQKHRSRIPLGRGASLASRSRHSPRSMIHYKRPLPVLVSPRTAGKPEIIAGRAPARRTRSCARGPRASGDEPWRPGLRDWPTLLPWTPNHPSRAR
jgi:hypothetical protein